MIRALLRLYPRWFRDRFGAEVAELLERSPHRLRDALNVAAHAAQLRSESLMTRPLRHLADFVMLTTTFGLGYLVNDLENGITEIARHWWSAFALVLAVGAIAARATISTLDARRDKPPAH
jgi:hypothetical protein